MRERVKCPLCGEERSAPWASENGWEAVKCMACPSVYVNPRPMQAEILQSAQTGLHEAGSGKLDTMGRYRRSKTKIFQRRLRGILSEEEMHRPSARWLDVGCGFGELLSAASGLLPQDSRLEGIEPSVRKRQWAERRGLAVSGAALESFPPESFDFVSLMDVFSHLPEPAEFLRQIAGLLKRHGRLILLTGNGGDLARGDYPGPLCLPVHLLFAGEAALVSLLERTGYRVLEVQSFADFFQEPEAVRHAKNLARLLLRRPLVSRRHGPFRDLLVKAGPKR